MKEIIRIGTRKSKLAMIQTEIVQKKIMEFFPDIQVKIVPISTKGDENLNRSLASFGGKGVFTKELEDALLRNEIDLAVHSAKDMPMEFPEGLCLGAVLQRADSRDVLITMNGIKACDLKPGSVIGTSSLRRELQIKEINEEVIIKVLRGNVQTRLSKLKEGQYDGIILAAAGLERLGFDVLHGFYYEYMDESQFIPAAGQGILAVETRQEDLLDIRNAIHCEEAALMLHGERSFLSKIGGSCNAPAGALAKIEGDNLVMEAMFVADGIHKRQAKGKCCIEDGMDGVSQLGHELAQKVTCGKVYLVGAGPGDIGLLTRKGLNCVRQADVVVYDNLISSSILNEVKPSAQLIYAGKRASNHHLKQEEINALLVEKALEGYVVVRLKGGDPFIFGRGAEEALELSKANIPFEIVCGVSSCYAVGAYAGIPITDRYLASSFHVITGHEGSHKGVGKQKEVLDYVTLAKEEGTLVFLMGLANLSNITSSLIHHGKSAATPCAVIQKGTMAKQKMAVGTLSNIVDKVKEKGIETPAITIIGNTVSLSSDLDWFHKEPLSHENILLTGTKEVSNHISESLAQEGAQAVSFSLIHTKRCDSKELESAALTLFAYSWIVFTSNNGVDIFFDYLKEINVDIRSMSKVKFAAIGKGTALALKERGIICDFVPSLYSSANLAKEWVPNLKNDDHVLLLRAKEASPVLLEALQEKQVPYNSLPLYDTIVDYRKKEELDRIIGDMDYVVFASASAVNAFANLIEDKKALEAKIICIGPVTEKAAINQGLTVYKTAKTYCADGIKDVILSDCKTDRNL